MWLNPSKGDLEQLVTNYKKWVCLWKGVYDCGVNYTLGTILDKTLSGHEELRHNK